MDKVQHESLAFMTHRRPCNIFAQQPRSHPPCINERSMLRPVVRPYDTDALACPINTFFLFSESVRVRGVAAKASPRGGAKDRVRVGRTSVRGDHRGGRGGEAAGAPPRPRVDGGRGWWGGTRTEPKDSAAELEVDHTRRSTPEWRKHVRERRERGRTIPSPNSMS
jgi:hypothetical protein